MNSGSRVIVLVAALATCACGEMGNPNYFKSEVDSDVGIGSGDDTDTGTGEEQLEGDPCDPEQNPWGCDPLTAEGCQEDGSACDYGVYQGVSGFYCFGDGTEAAGAACDTSGIDGPWCVPNHTCRDGVCVRFCCSADDCDGQECEAVDWESIEGTLGTCPAPPDTDTDTDTDTGTD